MSSYHLPDNLAEALLGLGTCTDRGRKHLRAACKRARDFVDAKTRVVSTRRVRTGRQHRAGRRMVRPT